jgi:hypothetical protein
MAAKQTCLHDEWFAGETQTFASAIRKTDEELGGAAVPHHRFLKGQNYCSAQFTINHDGLARARCGEAGHLV